MQQVKLLNVFVIILLTMLVASCGIIPMPISIVHTGIDVILHEKTGKTSGEHILSDITQKDCKFVRVLDTQKICMTDKEYEEYLLSLNCDTYTWDVIGRVSCDKNKK